MIGIAGDSGAGKSTLSDGLQALFGARHLDVICGDDMHKWQRGHDRWWNSLTSTHAPTSFTTSCIICVRSGKNRLIWRRHYDHNTGRFTEDHPIKPRSVMILEGLHAYYLKPARELYDLKIFVKPDADVLLHRKVVRDMRKRNYTKEAVIAAVQKRMADSRKYIVTQERFADIVVSFLSRETISADDIGRAGLLIDERLRITLSNAFFFDKLVDDLHEAMPGNLHHYYDDNDLQVLEFDHPFEIEDIKALAEGISTACKISVSTIQNGARAGRVSCNSFLGTVYFMGGTTDMQLDLEALASASRRIGTRSAYVQGGGGNTSLKDDHGRMAIKASGTSLATVEAGTGFIWLDVLKLREGLVDCDNETTYAALLKELCPRRP